MTNYITYIINLQHGMNHFQCTEKQKRFFDFYKTNNLINYYFTRNVNISKYI